MDNKKSKVSIYQNNNSVQTIRRRTAFTLIELLVVVSIIALLIAILLPSLAKARNRARQSACASNARQIGIGGLLYLQENGALWSMTAGGTTEWFGGVDSTTGQWKLANGYLGPYLQSTKVLTCQECNSKGFAPYMPLTGTVKPPLPYELDYGTNMLPSNVSYHSISQVSSLSETLFFAECQMVSSTTPVQVGAWGWVLSIRSSSAINTIIGPHGNGLCNVAFFDGHAEVLPVYVRPVSAMYSVPSPSALALAQQLHIGDLPYRMPMSTDTASAPAYFRAGGNTATTGLLDYYFWIDKAAKQ